MSKVTPYNIPFTPTENDVELINIPFIENLNILDSKFENYTNNLSSINTPFEIKVELGFFLYQLQFIL